MKFNHRVAVQFFTYAVVILIGLYILCALAKYIFGSAEMTIVAVCFIFGLSIIVGLFNRDTE